MNSYSVATTPNYSYTNSYEAMVARSTSTEKITTLISKMEVYQKYLAEKDNPESAADAKIPSIV